MSLPYYKDIQYIQKLPLKNFKKVSNGYRCSCPKCKEGKSPWKTRCNIILPSTYHQHVTVYCFNCSWSTNVKNLVMEVLPNLITEYEQDEKEEFFRSLKNGTTSKKFSSNDHQKIHIEKNNKDLDYQFSLNKKYFKKACLYKEVVEFCKKRNIIDYIDKFYYNINPDSVCGGMIIFPFETKQENIIYGFQGRHIKFKRFHTHSTNSNFKVYNIFNVNYKKPIYVCESIIDTFAINNSIAMVGADISKNIIENYLSDAKLIFCPDNDSTGLQKAKKYSKEGYDVFVWPDSIKTKDFNDLSCSNYDRNKIKSIIDENTFSGAELQMRLSFKELKKRGK